MNGRTGDGVLDRHCAWPLRAFNVTFVFCLYMFAVMFMQALLDLVMIFLARVTYYSNREGN